MCEKTVVIKKPSRFAAVAGRRRSQPASQAKAIRAMRQPLLAYGGAGRGRGWAATAGDHDSRRRLGRVSSGYAALRSVVTLPAYSGSPWITVPGDAPRRAPPRYSRWRHAPSIRAAGGTPT